MRALACLVVTFAVSDAGCRSVGERPTRAGAVAELPVDASDVAQRRDASAARADAGVVAAHARPSPFAVVATVGGFGRLHRLAEGELVFASRGVFRRLTPSGGIERLGDLDIERRGIEVANNVDAIATVAGTLPGPMIVSTHHGHFRSTYDTKNFVYDNGRFTLSQGGAAYDKIVRWKDDVLLGHTSGLSYDATGFEAPELPGLFVVVRGKRIRVPELPKRFIVMAWTALADGSVFATGAVKKEEGTWLTTASTLLVWNRGENPPATLDLPDLPPEPWIDGLLGNRADDLWISGSKGYLAHRDAGGLKKVKTPCPEIVAGSVDADGRVYLICGDDRHGPVHDPRPLFHKVGTVHVRSGDAFEELTLPDFTRAEYAEKLRSSFYPPWMGLFVDVEDASFVAAPKDETFVVYDVAARSADDVWMLAYSENADRTAILRRGPPAPVRSLDHEDAVRENEQPAPAATRACPSVFVSLGEPTTEAVERARKNDDPTHRPFTARVHQTKHLGFVVSDRPPEAFKQAQSTAAEWAKSGFAPKLLCRTPVALSMPIPGPP